MCRGNWSPSDQEAKEEGRSQSQGSPVLQAEFKASKSNLIRPHLKIESEKGAWDTFFW